VIALITPPVNRPRSADRPDVSTAVSSIASSTNRFCGDPNRLSLTSMPLTRNTLSNATAPWIDNWPALGVLVVSPGASCAIPESVRGVASASISSCSK
jgi:hypothetical protein